MERTQNSACCLSSKTQKQQRRKSCYQKPGAWHTSWLMVTKHPTSPTGTKNYPLHLHKKSYHWHIHQVHQNYTKRYKNAFWITTTFPSQRDTKITPEAYWQTTPNPLQQEIKRNTLHIFKLHPTLSKRNQPSPRGKKKKHSAIFQTTPNPIQEEQKWNTC